MDSKTVLITGAGRGIGAATALLCAEQGYDLALNYARDEASALALAEQIRALGRRALLVQADVSQEAEVLRIFATIDAELGPLTALVNNAGIVAPGARLDQMTAERMRRVFEVNVLGSFLCAREAVRRMSRSNGGTGGAIVNVSSRAAQLGSPGVYVDYAASKGAIDTFTIGLAREVAGEGIRVNGVRPGIIDTEIHAGGGLGAQLNSVVAGLPMARMGTAQEIAQAIVWLLSDAASYTTGALLDVSGGR
ncbi:MAG: SDR family oxidoreductase [Burkholderiaceae bacterium]|nr:SDR family oxidoreductase [Burkholderiaceae bacterium]